MEHISKTDMIHLVNNPSAIKQTETPSLPESSALMLAGMLHMAAAQAKTTVTPAESSMWARQVQGSSAEVIEQFFTEWMQASHFMPAFSDWHDWCDRRAEEADRRRKAQEYEAYKLNHIEEVTKWRQSAEYECDMEVVRKKLEPLQARAIASAKQPTITDIPLAFSPEKEKEIIKKYIEERK